jgi:hypothetical protein
MLVKNAAAAIKMIKIHKIIHKTTNEIDELINTETIFQL